MQKTPRLAASCVVNKVLLRESRIMYLPGRPVRKVIRSQNGPRVRLGKGAAAILTRKLLPAHERLPQVKLLGYQAEHPIRLQLCIFGGFLMKPSVSFIAANILCACMSTSQPANAEASPGVCNIKPADFLATFGYAASGQALAGNPLGIPVGAFTYVGTATGKTASQNGNNIVGTWSMTFEQNDTSGHVNTFTRPETEAHRPNPRRYRRLSPTGKNRARDRTAWLGDLDSNQDWRSQSPYLGIDFIYLFRKLGQKTHYMLQ